ncbi:hypothetical protein [Delftia sp. PS-11]|uniref:hypothetical protein n=1 Tax=Delftia sp. PS-11 TaxID=2767222 RepID=UPI0024574257|nr:hypothetical protein [Delftia sp. PS-11]KAJ8744835.1 hypothetical protein H9T68_10170 [Delftia sp. PS-11]
MLSFFKTSHVKKFGKELASVIMKDLNSSQMKKDSKFMEKAQKTLTKADRLVQKFKLENKLNFYQRSQLANAFLWSLRDAGCPEAYANQLTDWLLMQMQ